MNLRLSKLTYSLALTCIIGLVLLTACATIPPSEREVLLISKDYRFIDEIFISDTGQNRNVKAWLVLPEPQSYSPPYPAVVFLHSSWGLSKQERHYAKLFADLGVASVLIDSFKPRGVRRTSQDQSLVSTPSMMADAFAALDYLSNDSRFRSDRVAVMGFSKGAIAALYTSISSVQQAMTVNGDKFAAHLAFYPWCGVYLQNMQTTGVPIAIHGGTKDIVTPIGNCEQFVEEQLLDATKDHIQLVSYEDARHAFDHPVLQNIPFVVPMDVQVPGDCLFVEQVNGKFRETSTQSEVSGDNFKEVLSLCSDNNGAAGRDRQAAKLAGENAKLFIQKSLLN